MKSRPVENRMKFGQPKLLNARPFLHHWIFVITTGGLLALMSPCPPQMNDRQGNKHVLFNGFAGRINSDADSVWNLCATCHRSKPNGKNFWYNTLTASPSQCRWRCCTQSFKPGPDIECCSLLKLNDHQLPLCSCGPGWHVKHKTNYMPAAKNATSRLVYKNMIVKTIVCRRDGVKSLTVYWIIGIFVCPVLNRIACRMVLHSLPAGSGLLERFSLQRFHRQKSFSVHFYLRFLREVVWVCSSVPTRNEVNTCKYIEYASIHIHLRTSQMLSGSKQWRHIGPHARSLPEICCNIFQQPFPSISNLPTVTRTATCPRIEHGHSEKCWGSRSCWFLYPSTCPTDRPELLSETSRPALSTLPRIPVTKGPEYRHLYPRGESEDLPEAKYNFDLWTSWTW